MSPWLVVERELPVVPSGVNATYQAREEKKGRENEFEREQTKLFVAGRLLHVVILPGSHFSVAERNKSPDARPGLRSHEVVSLRFRKGQFLSLCPSKAVAKSA
jgi:hypothetical protein